MQGMLSFLLFAGALHVNLKDLIESGKNPYGEPISVTIRRDVCRAYYNDHISKGSKFIRGNTPTKRKRKNF